MEKVRLTELTSFLTSLSAEDFQGNGVDDYLNKSDFDLRDFFSFAYFCQNHYARNLIVKTDRFELLLLTWMPGQRTPIHDHAGSRCWVAIHSGQLCIKSYQPIVSDEAPLVAIGSATTHFAGEVNYVDDGIAVHSITNNAQDPAVSLHLYAPPVARCRAYDEAARKFRTVQLSYFTTPKDIPSRRPPPELGF